MDERPLILLTNDDGYYAEGISVLFERLKDLADVVIVAPDRERSAVSLALTLHHPLRVKPLQPSVYAVAGTPADCVYLALKKILPRKPDLLISGINHGPNLGQQDVSYSGTVAGAVQGTYFEVPSMAVSSATDEERRFDAPFAADLTRLLVRYFLRREVPPGVTLNVNFPPPPPKGVRVTRLGQKRYSPDILENRDPRGLPYFWIGLGQPKDMADSETDIEAVREGYISVTPLHADLTNYDALRHPSLEGLKINFSPGGPAAK